MKSNIFQQKEANKMNKKKNARDIISKPLENIYIDNDRLRWGTKVSYQGKICRIASSTQYGYHLHGLYLRNVALNIKTFQLDFICMEENNTPIHLINY